MSYYPKYVEDFVKTPSTHLTDNYKDSMLTSVIISTIQKPSKIESTNYAFDLEVFFMPYEMEKSCFVMTFDEESNIVNGSWFKEHEINKISPNSNKPGERFIFDKCLERYEAFIEKLNCESDYPNQ